MVSAKMDLLIKRLEQRANEKQEVMHIHDSHMTCEECGNTRHSGSNYSETHEDVNFVNNNYSRPQQNQGWNQQQRPNYQSNYQGNYQGNNFNNFNQPPLRELIAGQSKLMEGLSRKVATNDKILENINNRMDSFASAIKNQHSFNKMIESQIAQLMAVVPPSDKGKIPRQLEDLETANLVDIHNAAFYYTQPLEGRWIDHTLPGKKGDPGRPAIPIAIGPYIFQEAVCDFRASVNIMPKVIYDQINGDTLLYTNMHL